MPESQCLKRDVGGKKSKLLCCKRIFPRIKGNLAEIQPKNHQNAQNVPGVNGLISLRLYVCQTAYNCDKSSWNETCYLHMQQHTKKTLLGVMTKTQ